MQQQDAWTTAPLATRLTFTNRLACMSISFQLCLSRKRLDCSFVIWVYVHVGYKKGYFNGKQLSLKIHTSLSERFHVVWRNPSSLVECPYIFYEVDVTVTLEECVRHNFNLASICCRRSCIVTRFLVIASFSVMLYCSCHIIVVSCHQSQ
jgi:hypothetical protein